MFKRNISYILMFIIVLFGFNMEVDAASNLSCVYNVGSQYSDIGIKKVWLIRNPEWFPAKKNKDPNRPDLDTVVYVTEDENASTKIQPGTRQSEEWYDIFAYYDEKQNRNVTLNVEVLDEDNGNTGYSTRTFATKYVYLGDINVCPSYLYINKKDAWEENKITFDFKFLDGTSGKFVLVDNYINSNEIPTMTCEYNNSEYAFTQDSNGGLNFYHKLETDRYEKINPSYQQTSTTRYYNLSRNYFQSGPKYLSAAKSNNTFSFNFNDEAGLSLDGGVCSSEIKQFQIFTAVNSTDSFNFKRGEYCSVEELKNQWLIEPDENIYDNSCLYFANLPSQGTCEVIQIDFSPVNLRVSSTYLFSVLGTPGGNSESIQIKFNSSDITNAFGGQCPINVYADMYKDVMVPYQKIYLSIPDSYVSFSRVRSLKDIEDIKLVVDEVKIETCEDLLSDELINYLNTGIKALKIIVPLILIGLGVLDFAKGVFSSEDDMKKIQQKFIKRVILGVGFFLIPTVIQLLLNIASEIWGISNTFCGLQL